MGRLIVGWFLFVGLFILEVFVWLVGGVLFVRIIFVWVRIEDIVVDFCWFCGVGCYFIGGDFGDWFLW